MATVILFDVFIPSRNPHVLANSQITDATEKLWSLGESQVKDVKDSDYLKKKMKYLDFSTKHTESKKDLFPARNGTRCWKTKQTQDRKVYLLR